MADRAKTISELPIATSLSGDELFVVVDDPSGTANTKQITLNNIFANSTANVTLANASVLSANTLITRNKQTPANSTITVTKGTILFDDDYLYIATDNNTLKRIALTSF
jgi:CTP:phosphocholine cytidylyltransferase-like protein